jgi:autotransporter passenger strand-loop-strand repeat protein
MTEPVAPGRPTPTPAPTHKENHVMTTSTVNFSDTASNVVVSGGDFLVVFGAVSSTIVSTGGTEEVQSTGGAGSGGIASFTTVSNGGFEFVSAGGTTVSTTVDSGGSQTVFVGGTASFTTVSHAGFQNVSSGGTASFTTVNSGGSQNVLLGGVAISGSVDSSGTENVASSGTASFTTVSSGGAQNVSSGGTAISGSVNSDGAENVNSSGTANFTTVSGGGFEVLSAGASASGTTVDLSGSIILMALPGADGGTATVDSSTDMLTVSQGGGPVYTQQLSGTYTNTESFDLLLGTGPYAGGAQVELEGTLCFCIDTLIETPAGQVKVQNLAVGDLVMTRRGVARPITWIGTGAVLATRGQRGAATPVIVHKGALADNVPTHDLRVTKGHSLYIDHVLIPVEFLVNHRSIEWDDRAQEVKLFHIELETHDILIANGAPAESYRDDGNRWLFRNVNDAWMEPPKAPYAPVLTGGPLVDEAWRRLLDRAGPRPGLPLTEDADLHLEVDGQRLDAMARRGETLVFRLLARPETVRVVSRSGAPQELGVARDPRELGVALWRIMLRQGPRLRMIEAEDAALAEGFHGYEAAHQFRWTDGDALLPAALYDGLHGGFELELHVACSARYGVAALARAVA